MKAVEAVKVKFNCFLGTVHNTVGEPDYQTTHKMEPLKTM